MKNHSWLNFLVFTCFLVIGYRYSSQFYIHRETTLPDAPKVLAESQNSIETMLNGQRSFLLIAASAINTASPHVESIWLASYFPSDTTVRMMPVFPSIAHQAASFDDQINRSFRLSKSRGSFQLDPGFIEVLENNNYWWSGYFILDEFAITKLANLMVEGETDRPTSPGDLAGMDHPELRVYPGNGYASQIATLQSACQQFIQKNQGVNLSQMISLLSDHLLTDLDNDQIKLEWDTLNSGEHNPSCRFPTLEISRLEQ
jgi:hypothetical protein